MPVEVKMPSEPAPAAKAASKFRAVSLASTGGTLQELVQKEVALAKAANLRPYLEFTAGWCKPCVAFKKSMHDPLMEDALEGTYVIMADFDDWSKEAAAMGVVGIPTWIALDDSGAPTSKRITSSVWGEDIPVNMAPPLKAFFHPAAAVN